jgi:hypothetical protein
VIGIVLTYQFHPYPFLLPLSPFQIFRGRHRPSVFSPIFSPRLRLPLVMPDSIYALPPDNIIAKHIYSIFLFLSKVNANLYKNVASSKRL